MKIEIEVDDKLARKLEQKYQVDVRVLVENFVKKTLPLLEEVALAADSGALSLEKVGEAGYKAGSEIFRSALKRTKKK